MEIEKHNPSKLLEDETLLTDPASLPEAEGHTSTVYRAEEGGYQYNLHSYLARFEGRFWAIWSSGLIDEDSPQQVVRCATSEDGHSWSPSEVLTSPPPTADGPGVCIARGIFVHLGTLTALVAFLDRDLGSTWENREAWPRGWPERWINLRLMKFQWDGERWEEGSVFLDDAMSKNYSGLLSNGWYYLINNPVREGFTTRDPLTISFSRDGWAFAHPKNLRQHAPPQQFTGSGKDANSFQYPHALEHNDSLWVIYSTNKEDIEISEYVLEQLVPG